MDKKITWYKAYLVAKVFEKRKCIDFEEIFSPVVKSFIIYILLAPAAFDDLNIERIDLLIAYLDSEIDVILYIESKARLRMSMLIIIPFNIKRKKVT